MLLSESHVKLQGSLSSGGLGGKEGPSLPDPSQLCPARLDVGMCSVPLAGCGWDGQTGHSPWGHRAEAAGVLPHLSLVDKEPTMSFSRRAWLE